MTGDETQYVKYPRTPHLPWSPGRSSDDIALDSIEHLRRLHEVVVTEKLDGECTTMYRDHVHARSIDSGAHESRDWVKRLHSQIKNDIPERIRICGENMYAKHSIFYDSLTTFFNVFAIFESDTCLSWDETLEWCGLLSLEPVPLLYRGVWNEKTIQSCWTGKSAFGREQEGYVVRNAGRFSIDKFKDNTAKFVREGHVTADEHWMKVKVVPNLIKFRAEH
jgi:hypothetical protein